MWLENFQHKILAQISANHYLNFYELLSVKKQPINYTADKILH